MDYKIFSDPPAEFRSVPFYSLNDRLEGAELSRQLAAFAQGGFGGAYLHSRTGLLTEYLGEGWWQAIDAGVEACEKLGIEAWFYDEDKWPSGFAGGRVPAANEAFRARSIFRLKKDMPVSSSDEVLSEDEQYRYVCHTMALGHPWFNGVCWVDLLNQDAVKAFIEESYRPYAERYASKLGGVAKGIFTDEPQFNPLYDEMNHAGVVSYSPAAREDFRRQYGYDIVDHLPCLFAPVGDYRRVRLHYYRTLGRMFEQSFSRPIGEYCRAAGLTWTGHVNGEDSLMSVTEAVGNAMIQYRHFERPGIDHLCLRIEGGASAAKSCSSVANQYGMPRRLSEMFGVSGQNMNFEDRKWIADWHAIMGINHVCPHLSLYSMKGCRKRDYPPTLSPQQPWWPHNRMLENHLARVSYAGTLGQYAPEMLVIHPLESGYLEFVPRDNDEVVELNRRYNHVVDSLARAHRDFDLGDEQILADIGRVDGRSLRVGQMGYPLVLLPHLLTIRPSTLALLQEFAAAGGTILAVGNLPGLVDAQSDPAALESLAKVAQIVRPEDLQAELARLLPPAVRVEGKGSESVFIHRRLVEGGQIILLTNISRLKGADCTVYLAEEGPAATLWLPSSGRCLSLRPKKDGGFRLRLAPAETFILTTGAASAGAAVSGTYRVPTAGRRVLTLQGPWAGKRLDPNALTLDFARYSTDGGQTFSEPEPVIGIHERFTDTQWSGPLVLRFDFTVEQAPAACDLAIEQPEMYRQLAVNGRPLPADAFVDGQFYRDHTFRCARIADLLKNGPNSIELRLDYVAPQPSSVEANARYGSEIETIYLVGEFGVAAVQSARRPAPTERNAKKFLPRRDVHRFSRFAIGTEQQQFGNDLAPQGYPCFAGSFELQCRFDMPPTQAKKRYFLAFPEVEAIVISAELNGRKLPAAAWSPWEIEITEALAPGENHLKLTLTNSLRNLLGPHHHRDGELVGVGPDSFAGRGSWTGGGPGDANWYDKRRKGLSRIWRDDYHCIPFGLLQDPQIIVR